MAGEILAQLPEDLRTNEAFTGMSTAGDIAKAYLDTKGKLTEFDGKVKEYEGKVGDLEGKLTNYATNYIPKLTEKATDAERAAYRKAMDVPDKPEAYEFPKLEGLDNDPNMVKWGQNLFHRLGIPKAAGEAIAGEWNQFIHGMVQAEEELDKKEREDAGKAFRATFKTDEEYNGAVEGVARFWKKVTDTDMTKFVEETGIGNHPTFIKLIYNLAKKAGEDMSPKGSSQKTGEPTVGLTYPNSPQPPSQEVR